MVLITQSSGVVLLSKNCQKIVKKWQKKTINGFTRNPISLLGQSRTFLPKSEQNRSKSSIPIRNQYKIDQKWSKTFQKCQKQCFPTNGVALISKTFPFKLSDRVPPYTRFYKNIEFFSIPIQIQYKPKIDQKPSKSVKKAPITRL